MTDGRQDAALITLRCGMPSEVRFAEVRKTLERNGYVLVRITGSHHVFKKAGERPMIVPVHHGKVDYVYVREVQKRIQGD